MHKKKKYLKKYLILCVHKWHLLFDLYITVCLFCIKVTYRQIRIALFTETMTEWNYYHPEQQENTGECFIENHKFNRGDKTTTHLCYWWWNAKNKTKLPYQAQWDVRYVISETRKQSQNSHCTKIIMCSNSIWSLFI